MGASFDDTMAIQILVASLNVTDLVPVAASIKRLWNDKLSWEEVSNRRVEEVKSITTGHSSAVPAATATTSKHNCAICHKTSHVAADFYLNPMSSKCKIDVPKDDVGTVLGSACASRWTKKSVEAVDMGKSPTGVLPWHKNIVMDTLLKCWCWIVELGLTWHRTA